MNALHYLKLACFMRIPAYSINCTRVIKIVGVLVFISQSLFCQAQEMLNFSFEETRQVGVAMGWNSGGKGFDVYLDSAEKVDGKYSYAIKANGTSGFGVFSRSIPSNYIGERVRLVGYIKTKDVDDAGFAGLWLRMDGPQGVIAIDNMQRLKVTGTNDWKKYTIELPFDELTQKITVGGLLSGTSGTLWVDSLQLLIDEHDVRSAPRVSPAILNRRRLAKSGIDSLVLDNIRVQNLALLCQVWGFLKYFHPTISQGEMDWDGELFRTIAEYNRITSMRQRDQYLLTWIEKFGPIERCDSCANHGENLEKNVKLRPDFGWQSHANVGSALKEKLDQIYQNRVRGGGHYVRTVPGVGNSKFRNELAYNYIDKPDLGFRLLALFRYWNMVQYFYPYRYTIGKDWSLILKESISKFGNANGRLAYRLAILELMGQINDSHATMAPDSVIENFRGRNRAAVQVKFVEGKLIVTNYYDSVLGRKSGLNRGDIVTSINGKRIQEIADSRIRYYPGSNGHVRDRDFARDLLRTNGNHLALTIKRGNTPLSVDVDTYPAYELNSTADWIFKATDSCYSFVADRIGYINLSNIKADRLPQIFSAFRSTKGIIVDVRNYPSDFVPFKLSAFLSATEVPFVKFTLPDLNCTGAFTWSEPLKIGGTMPDVYHGKVVVLVNEITQSMGEYTVMALQAASNAIVLGSQTAGADGNISDIVLPGNIKTSFSGLGVYYPDGRETQRVGISPIVRVEPTIQGIALGQDETLRKAILLINGK